MNTSVPSAERLPLRQRVFLGTCGVGLGALLLLAGSLRPSPSGYGTHEQLGLPPCTFQWIVGIRCPSCGMTTSWSHAMRLEFGRALRANVGGTLLAFAAVAAVPWCAVSAFRGRYWSRLPSDRTLAAAAIMLVAITLVDWVVRLSTR